MSELQNNPNGFKEAVCIEAQRIFDSCSDRDCLEDLEVSFENAEDTEIVEQATYVKIRCVEVISTYFSVEPVPFNRGFYSVDITYTFAIEAEVTGGDPITTSIVNGTTTFTKKVILFGSDGNTKVFSSDENNEITQNGCCYTDAPKVTVSVVEPIVLETKLRPRRRRGNCCCCDEEPVTERGLYVTIGMFSIVRLSRSVPILIPAYNYCVPQKQCSSSTDSPCELFEKISFPTSEFFPKGLEDDVSVTNDNECCD